MKILELFAGSRSIGKEADALGFETFSCDWEPYEGIDHVGDVEEMTVLDIPFVPDAAWASPDCKTYSIAAISTHRDNGEPRSEYAKKCDSANAHFLNMFEQILEDNPDFVYFIENPRGYLRKMPFLLDFLKQTGGRRETVWYCQYGDDRAKPTDIFTNSKIWVPRPVCHNGNILCHHEPAPRGSKTGTQGRKNSYERSKIPQELCREVMQSLSL